MVKKGSISQLGSPSFGWGQMSYPTNEYLYGVYHTRATTSEYDSNVNNKEDKCLVIGIEKVDINTVIIEPLYSPSSQGRRLS